MPASATIDSSDATRLAALIREQSAEEVAHLMAEAEHRARNISARAEAEVQGIRTAAEREGAERGRRQAAELVAVAEAKSRVDWLRAREALLDAAIARARTEVARLAAMPDAAALLANLIRESVAALPDGPLRLRGPAEYEPVRAEAFRLSGVGERFVAALEPMPVAGGGVIVETEDGRLRFDNSFAARLHRERDHVRRAAAEVLFSEETAERG